MNLRVVGFALVSLSVIATILAFSIADDYVPNLPLAYNLQNATLFRVVEVTYEQQEDNTFDCPSPLSVAPHEIPVLCPETQDEYDRRFRARREREVVQAGIPLGYAVAGMAALALAGVGLMVFGKKE